MLRYNVHRVRNDAMYAFARCKNASIKLEGETICSDESCFGNVKNVSRIRCKTYPTMFGALNNVTTGLIQLAGGTFSEIQGVFIWVVSVQYRTAFGSVDPLLLPWQICCAFTKVGLRLNITANNEKPIRSSRRRPRSNHVMAFVPKRTPQSDRNEAYPPERSPADSLAGRRRQGLRGYGDSAFICSAMQRSLVRRKKCTAIASPKSELSP